MARINQDDVDAVRDRTDIVKLVQQHVALKKAGRSFSGLCPFHQEKTPSFTVDPGKGVYYCFGCGAGGNAYTFVMETEQLTFPEAVERLAGPAGVTLRYEGAREDSRTRSRRDALFRANDRAAALYHRTLLEGREGADARRYLEERGISRAAAERFRIGYAPGYPDFLLRRMSKEFSPEILVEAGLAMTDAGRGIRDSFRARVTFPVRDLAGRGVGFGARLLEGDGPKYLNTRETPIYDKRGILYNLDAAKVPIGKGEPALVVEGYTDVIALAEAGIETAVATCGTALTEDHFRQLSRFVRGGSAILAFDSDEAGARAAERAYGFFEGYPMEVRVLILPAGLDPADFVRERGPEAFLDHARRAQPLVEYMVRRALRDADLDTPEGRARAVQAAVPIVSRLEDPVRRDQYAGMLADLAGVSGSSVLLELERADRPAEGARPGTRRAGTGRPRTPSQEVEKEALKLLAQAPEVATELAREVESQLFETERYRRAFELLRVSGAHPARLVESAGESGLGDLVAQLTLEPLTGDPTREYAGRVFSRLEELFLGREIAIMKKRLERLNPAAEAGAYDSLFEQLIALEARRRSVRTRAGAGEGV